MPLRLRVEGTAFRDANDREVTLHGINVAGDAKNPRHPDQPSHEPKNFFDGDNVSFVGRPFDLDEAPKHFERLRQWGYNTMRYIFTWEAIEAAGPGKYDEAWIQHTISVLRIAKDFGFYVFMDPHQDVWSRFTGGSGAPMWTLYACGLDPKAFNTTEAALVQNSWPNPEEFPKMIWATNYTRLACQALFTMFFAGKSFAPRAIIDGKNIQDYLQEHYFAACKHLAVRIREAGDLDHAVVIGWESLNEPNKGLIGAQDISIVPAEQQLQKGTSPTAWQAILTGSGRPCEIETWGFAGTGPYKTGKRLVDPKGQVAWLSPSYDDSRYGWKRDPGWKLGECLWAQHGVWDPATDTLLKKDYFAKDPKTGAKIDYEYFVNNWFMDHYRGYRDAIRSVFPNTIMFCQPPNLELPPTIKGTADDDPNMVYAPHWYDGLTLITKKWNRYWNIDVFGVLRGRYLTPAFAVRLGESAIRNCFRDQLLAIRKEGFDNMGVHPCVFTELGIPYDMEQGKAYQTGDFTSQSLAMDANHFALEGAKVGFTLWNYTANNTHEWGDQWNGEDLSISSLDDLPLPQTPFTRHPSPSAPHDQTSPSYSASHLSSSSSASTLKQTMNQTTNSRPSTSKSTTNPNTSDPPSRPGPGDYRAAEAFVRPYPTATHGDLLTYGFDLKKCEFRLSLSAETPTAEGAPTEVFLPEYHFPAGFVEVKVSGGKFEVVREEIRGQVLRWWHAGGEQTLWVKGVVKRAGMGSALEGCEGGYLERCREKGCVVM